MTVTATEHLITSFDGQTLYAKKYQTTRKPKKQLFFVHGLAGDAAAFEDIIDTLLYLFPDTECIAYDLRGHGLSTRVFPPTPARFFEVNVLDLKNVLLFFKATHPILIGHSLGGMIIQEYLNLKVKPIPERIALVSSAPQTPKLSPIPGTWYSLLKKYTQLRSPQSRKRSFSDHQKFMNCGDYSPSRIANDIHYTHFSCYALMFLSVFGWKNPQINHINLPSTLYIYGTKDKIILPVFQKKYLNKLSEVQVVPLHATHNSIVTNSQAIAQTLAQWLKTEPQSKPAR